LLWLFGRWGSRELFARVGLELRSSQSQPPKEPGLQVGATGVWLALHRVVDQSWDHSVALMTSQSDFSRPE
jgi:hypothetical protein